MKHTQDEPVYYISIAARLISAHPQTLRMYERAGLVQPRRTPQGLRLYSERDIERLRQIQRLTQELGVNLAGVDVVLKLLDQIADLQGQIERLKHERDHGPLRLKAAPERQRVEIRIQAEDE
ncbi:MAG: MerR family transcriptional regulator [Armatimonadia bacterium]